MGKFLSGGQFSGDTVPLCAFWRNDVETDVTTELSLLRSTGQGFAQKDAGKDSAIGSFDGQCIANAFYPKSTITCFNSGQCNGEGKCLTCSRYRAGGVRMAITHSPPLDTLRYFDKGLTEDEIKSPNLVRFPPDAAQAVEQDQLPYHILVRNIQAEIAKCCHWNAGDGAPSEFYLDKIKLGTDTATFTNSQGENVTYRGVRVKDKDVFPDEVGTFFPAGTVVVAGFADQPSFYLEPRTGLIKPGEDVLFNFSGEGTDVSPATVTTKQLASSANSTVDDAVNAAIFACQAVTEQFTRDTAFYNNALNSGDPDTIAAAEAKLATATANKNTACTAASDATTAGQDCIDLIADTIQSDNSSDLQTNSTALASKLSELADLVEEAGSVAGSTSAADQTSRQVALLRILARQLQFSSRGGQTKCEFFYQTNNVAESWNSPADGSLPCNGVRTDCPYYTGEPWVYATDEKMELGRPILAEQIQEVRFRAEDWSRYSDPEEEFRNRFSTPFIWAFSGYVDVTGEPEIEDMLLYKPKTLYGRGTAHAGYETVEMEKVRISNYDEFEVTKNSARIQPGSETLDKDGPPPFPSLISEPVVPSASRLSITHPRVEDEPFVYRMWSPDKNKITLFGTASPDQTIYLINNTALNNRSRYHTVFGTKNFFNVPTGLPKAPDFIGLTATELLAVVSELRNEKISNADIEAPLGFDEVSSNRQGFWQSIQEIDLVHNTINEVYAFLVGGETNVLAARILIDCRFLHSVIAQTSFEGTDFSMLSLGVGGSKLGTNAGDTIQKGVINAEGRQLVGAGTESVGFAYGYFALRFKDRGLAYGILNADNDLQGQNPVSDLTSELLVTEAAPSEFIQSVAYHVVQYKKEEQVVEDWYLINDCGYIMLKIEDPNVNRVLPLENQEGNDTAISDILINGGGRGSEVAQWGLTKVTLSTNTGVKELVQYHRDPDGLGLPANYVVVGPSLDGSGLNAFGRPDPSTDTIQVSYTFLRAQSTKHEPEGTSADEASAPELGDAVVTNNFHNDNLRVHKHAVSFQDGSLTAGGSTYEDRISQDQQEYVFVFSDGEGRPIGKKVTRLQIMYYDLACINVEIFYKWSADCTTYALIPDRQLKVGTAGGTLTAPLGATDDPNDDRLQLGFRIANLLGDRDCASRPNCGDHEYIKFGPLRREFEVIVQIEGADDAPGYLKANFPSAGQALEGEIVSSEPPGSQFLRRYGPLWYPYIACERPRYQFNTNGPLRTDSTELINTTLVNPGIVQGGTAIAAGGSASFAGQGGSFGALPPLTCEAYHGPDQVTPKILDIHPSLRPCTSAYTYGNQILKSGENRFSGYARRRGVVDIIIYEDLQWEPPPFGNFGRPQLIFEVSDERGDFIGTEGGQVGRRWMPMFPKRENMGATVDVFGETMEPQCYRLLGVSTPLGAVSENISTGSVGGGLTVLGVPRYTQKALVVNKTAASIEFPYSPYFPMFLPDDSIGVEPEDGRVPVIEGSKIGPISTMWAWREQEKRIQRGVTGGNILKGVTLDVPDYFIDNRRMEVRIRPDERSYVLSWNPPTYSQDGSLLTNASLKLGDGPPREVVIDFENRVFEVADQAGTLYDVTQELGEGALPCNEGVATDNPQLSATCSCITDISDPSLEGSGKLPSRFMHLDELAPEGEGFVGLYEDDTYQAPFAVDIPRERNTQPCCACIYYIRGIFFKLNGDYLPTITDIDPAFNTVVEGKYTWSRVPHGLESDLAVDGVFNSYEQLADNLVNLAAGDVFTTRIPGNRARLDLINDGGAIFPSSRLATSLILDEDTGGIEVKGALPAGDPRLKGGVPVNDDHESQGEDEEIVLTMLFGTYVRVTGVEVTFYAGVGFEAPKYELRVVSPQNRTQDLVTTNLGRTIGSASETAQDGNIPNRDDLDDEDVRDGRAKFISRVVPSYSDLPFWESYGMEWQLVFPRRGAAHSMGIVSVIITLDGLTYGPENTEIIGIRERKYYRSTGSVPDDLNPERFLGELDSATVYWRTTEKGAFKGHNRHRAYAFGDQIEDNQDRVYSSDIEYMEGLQAYEYDRARSLLETPYQYSFRSFTPLDEQKWLQLLGEGGTSWTLTMSNEISEVDEVIQPANNQPLYGVIPARQTFNAPGHVWVHAFEETYLPCCIGCIHSMIVNYEFLHLHDNLALVETASFWSELPSGFTRLIRSTMLLPDPTFQGGAGGVGSTVLLGAEQFTDSQGNAIPVEVLNAAGFSQNPTTGEFYVDSSSPEAAVGGPAGPSPDCGTSQ